MSIMQDWGLVSIITPTWGCGQYIAETIKCVLAQTYTDWELLVQDDCSIDGTYAEVKAYLNDSRIKYECNDKNSGAAVTRNNALRRARGRWIAFLDSDDLWEPTKLEKQVRFMRDNGYAFSYTRYQEIDQSGKPYNVEIGGPMHVSKMGMYAYCWPGCLTVMYDASKVGLIQIADIKKNNDYAMWLKVCRKADCYLLNECLAKYRIRSGSISNHSYAAMVKWHYRLFKDTAGMNTAVSVILTMVNLICGAYKKIVYRTEINQQSTMENSKITPPPDRSK